MKRFLLLTLAALLIFALCGCDSAPKTSETPAATQPADTIAPEETASAAAPSEPPAETAAPVETPTQQASNDTPKSGSLRDSVYWDFVQTQGDAKYYRLLPSRGAEPILLLASEANYYDSADAQYKIPKAGYYAYSIRLYTYQNGYVQHLEDFYSMTSILVDEAKLTLYKFFGQGGVTEDIAFFYADYDPADWESAYDTLDLDGMTDECWRNGEPISKAEHDQIIAQRDASRVMLEVYPLSDLY